MRAFILCRLDTLRASGHTIESPSRGRYLISESTSSLNPVEALAVHAAVRLLYHHSPTRNRYYCSALEKLAASAEVLTSLLLSLADEGLADMAAVQVLDSERRVWLTTLMLHVNKLSTNELRYAAGQAWAEDG